MNKKLAVGFSEFGFDDLELEDLEKEMKRKGIGDVKIEIETKFNLFLFLYDI